MKGKVMILTLAYSTFALAHNMSESLKKKQILNAIASYGSKVKFSDVTIEANPFSLDIELQLTRFQDGDKDIDHFKVKLSEKEYLECDLLSGEYGESKALYFLVYKNCEKVNEKNYKRSPATLDSQSWNDWRY